MQTNVIYRQFLKDEYERRRRKNAAYSLRAYARDLQIPSPKLSQYLNGDCGISEKRAQQLADKLSLSSVELELFVSSAVAEHARDPIARDRARENLHRLLNSTFSQLNLEKFALIRDWYHLAILELTDVDTLSSSVSWISEALAVPTERIREALDRLEKLGLLERKESHWVQTKKDFETPQDISSRAVREYHRQMMNTVEARIEAVPLEARELGSMVFALDQSLVPELKQMIRKFQKEVSTLVDRSPKKDSLYTLNCQLMPLYRPNEKPTNQDPNPSRRKP